MAGSGDVFRALADETRQLIVRMLNDRQMAAGEIAAAFKITQPAVSHHLNVLRRAGLVCSRRDGQRIIYALDRRPLHDCWQDFFGGLLGGTLPVEGSRRLPKAESSREGGESVDASKIA